ncbi:outer membrane protein assembly factor BamB [Rivibacter subsaxonicus]|uniref:Outer membrane protein assembly factor BamB n=1 Tax=Rivibacter subsaxonicus TaxID=457575 RepID=A0A4Q7VCP7_9BURK|nr:outer membrane protein assembly factor BamB [Rivibacter subsaxonicus]RZT92518.1 Beta-barrel assembly machine subunit BamB [Rivibacter subsaxonicus]
MSAARARGLAAALFASVLALAGCASSNRPDPTPLKSFTPQIAGKEVWRASIGTLKFPLRIEAGADRFTLSQSDGTVIALARDGGKELWRAEAGGSPSAGVGSDGRFTALVTTSNELVVLDGTKAAWRTRLNSRVVTPPLVAGERVFVLSVDRAVQAFDAADGRPLWTFRRPGGDPLTLLQPGVLMAWGDTLVAGQGPRMVGIDPLLGSLRWDTAVASPRGTNEVERLADLVAPAVKVGDMVCARAFQSAVGCVAAERGVLNWTKNVGGTEGIAADADYVFGADASDRITAWRRASGEVAWNNDQLLYRGLSAPLAVGRTVIFGDSEGYVHFLDRTNGTVLLRLPTDGKAIVSAPVASGTTILVVTSGGGVYAFRPE